MSFLPLSMCSIFSGGGGGYTPTPPPSPTTFYVMKEFGYIYMYYSLFFFFLILPSEFQVIISGSKKQQQKDFYQSEPHFQSYLVGHLENKGWHASSLLQIWHENNSYASLERKKGLNCRHRKIFGYVPKALEVHASSSGCTWIVCLTNADVQLFSYLPNYDKTNKTKKLSRPASKQDRFCQHKNLTDQCLKVFIRK